MERYKPENSKCQCEKERQQGLSLFEYGNSPLPYGVEPLILEVEFAQNGDLLLETAHIRRISGTEALIEAALVDTRLRPAAQKLLAAEEAI